MLRKTVLVLTAVIAVASISFGGAVAGAKTAPKTPATATDPVLLGDTNVETTTDSNGSQPEAWQYTASTSGSVTDIEAYDARGNARLTVGLYSDANGRPGTLLATGSIRNTTASAWNDVRVGSASITAGTKYWLVWQGTDSFRDNQSGNCSTVGGSSSIRKMGSSWRSAWTASGFCPASLYANGTASVAPPPPAPVAPSNMTAPSITGTPQQGDTLTASPGSWSGDTPISFAYRWSDGTTGQTDTLVAADVGHTVSVTVTASNDAGSASATSATVGPVTAPTPPPPALVPPTNTTAPAISGTPQVGDTLTVTNGTWAGDTPITYSVKWSDGTTGSSDTLTSADVGSTVTATVTASNDAGSASASSAAVGPVAAAAAGSSCTNSVSCWPNASNTGYVNAPGYPGSLTTASATSSTCPTTFQSNHTYSFCHYTGQQSIGSGSSLLSNVHFVGDLFENGDNNETIHLYCASDCTFDYITMKPLQVSSPNLSPHGTSFADSYGAIMYAGSGGYNTQGHGLSITHSNIWGYLTGIIIGQNTSASTPILIQDNYLHDQGDCIDASACTTHDDGIGMVDTGSTENYVTINHNYMPFVHDNTNDVAFQSGTYNHLTITNNLISGDGYTVAVWSTSQNITFTGNVLTNYAQQEFGWLYPQDFWDTPGSVWAHNKFLWDPTGVSPYYENGPGLGESNPITAADSGMCWVPSGLSTTDLGGGAC